MKYNNRNLYLIEFQYKRQRTPKGESKGQSRAHKMMKNTTKYVLDITNTNTVNKTRGLLQTTWGKDEPNIFFMRKS